MLFLKAMQMAIFLWKLSDEYFNNADLVAWEVVSGYLH
jgi:hypothetical protein